MPGIRETIYLSPLIIVVSFLASLLDMHKCTSGRRSYYFNYSMMGIPLEYCEYSRQSVQQLMVGRAWNIPVQ